jgi:transposase
VGSLADCSFRLAAYSFNFAVFPFFDTRARDSKSPEIRRLAVSLTADHSAVRAAFESPWSSGQVEGQINRLKFLNRQMYGRARLDLLRAPVLHPN